MTHWPLIALVWFALSFGVGPALGACIARPYGYPNVASAAPRPPPPPARGSYARLPGGGGFINLHGPHQNREGCPHGHPRIERPQGALNPAVSPRSGWCLSL
jgi:hypothetical protein